METIGGGIGCGIGAAGKGVDGGGVGREDRAQGEVEEVRDEVDGGGVAGRWCDALNVNASASADANADVVQGS